MKSVYERDIPRIPTGTDPEKISAEDLRFAHELQKIDEVQMVLLSCFGGVMVRGYEGEMISQPTFRLAESHGYNVHWVNERDGKVIVNLSLGEL